MRGAPGPPGVLSLSMTQALRDLLSLVCDNRGPQEVIGNTGLGMTGVSGVEGDRGVVKVEMDPETQIRKMAGSW